MAVESKSQAQDRAAAAQSMIAVHHVRRLLGVIPGTRIGAVAWPPVAHARCRDRLTASWNYWWQAHLVDLLVDGAIHRDDDRCATDAVALLRGILLHNGLRWTNRYYDDMAWMGLAVERVDRHLGRSHRRARRALTSTIANAWAPALGGGIPWRTSDTFFNAPANGPGAVLLARTGRPDRAVEMADWMHRELLLPSGLIADGLRVDSNRSRELDSTAFTYCQGVALGAEVEAYRITGDDVHLDRIDALVRAVTAQLTTDGVIVGAGGGDGGLFAGILARYLALVATDLPESAREVRTRAAQIVLHSADAVWEHRAVARDGLPVFGPDWRRPARVPDDSGRAARKIGGAVSSSQTPERDLSVQISAGMTLEAAVSVTIGSSEHTGSANPD
ncbi:glycoside hydrolase family 76 protein [Gordonia hydrophobica]|uniref:Glycoside hydrolase family 76 protein n=1 Tax=Gordonia hydrophobica TaxID=40516 RepID=A0ABZ2TVY3_9ACTN|nr:glycoside hydrolase family 76 protein [Gordonia hydrophobica]MBM7365927.1 putative alpha-1,6-mannanase (GH76 family) [Gordonia hydrophobica]